MKKLVILGVVGLIAVLLLIGSCSVVSPGTRGVLVTMGSVSNSVL
jgi:regulator of protease activity HflC (stomatin/prohibitin superfamily)